MADREGRREGGIRRETLAYIEWLRWSANWKERMDGDSSVLGSCGVGNGRDSSLELRNRI